MVSNRLTRRAVIVISSHVVRGSVGNRAAVFALEMLGFPVWAVPTIILPWHPGHGPATRIIPQAEQFGALLKDLERAPWLDEVGAVLSGYLGNAAQAESVASLVAAVKQRNRDALYLCDPVIGDGNGLYVPQETALAIKNTLLPLADIATPNRFELGWLAGGALDRNSELISAARICGPDLMLVTSSHASLAGLTGNLLVRRNKALLAEHGAVESPPNGPGDLMAAMFLAQILSGESDAESLRAATATVFEILSSSARSNADELMLESEARSLVRPSIDIAVVRVADAQDDRQ